MPFRNPILGAVFVTEPACVGGVDYGVVLLGRGGLVKYTSDNARRWLREYVGAESPTRLPTPVRTWLRSHGHRSANSDPRGPASWTLSVERQDRRLVIRLIPDRGQHFLLLEEQKRAPRTGSLGPLRLTDRESEVLAWVATGKTNPEIAAILGISARTVKKHLEHVYEKLGVETRMAAVAVAHAYAERRIDKRARAPYLHDTDTPSSAS